MHMVFYIKIDEDFTRRAILATDGHTIASPSSITYSIVVSRESVRISFLLSSLNYLDIFVCDIRNVYLNSKCKEKLWTESGTNFGT